MAEMTSRERLLAAVRHKEPDRVPVSPRVGAWMIARHGDAGLAKTLEVLPDMDFMHIVDSGTPNYIVSHPDEYRLPEVQVDQTRYEEGEFQVVERTFHTPAGKLSDRTKIAPSGREYGVSPNPIRTEHLVKGPDDLPALQYLIAPVNTNFDFAREAEAVIGDRGIVMPYIKSALDHHAGDARGMQGIMADYYLDRPLFDALMGIYHRHSMAKLKAALEAGMEWIFGGWYFTSLSSGWSPAIFEEVFIPLIREHVALTHSYGALYDYYDDGKLAGSMDMVADTGIDVLETCCPPPVGDFDLAAAKARIGDRVTLKGYVDLLYVVKHGTPELVTQTVREAMQIAKPGGGFIIGSSDSFREGTPDENIAAYFAACREYGVY
jgi:hypothetical protein